ncbi:MAG: hypothetical protein IJE08_07950 [Clostridia bacterium]|nr:hypothetical protein [Clostridia bacterium]
MNRLKRILFKVFLPPDWLSALIVLPSFALLVYVFAAGKDDTPLAYLSYFASAYSLANICMHIPGVLRAFRSGFEDHRLVRGFLQLDPVRKYRSDRSYRADTVLYAGLAANLLYALIKLISGIVYQSVWFGALAWYYLLLTLLRAALAHQTLKSRAESNPVSEWRRHRVCGLILLIMNQALSAVVFLVVRRNNTFTYPGFLIYAMAAYTFYAIFVAVRNLIRGSQNAEPIPSAIRTLNMVCALVSLLSLETAMLDQFSGPDELLFRKYMTGATGAVVCLLVLLLAIRMIAVSTRHLRAQRHK